jgi:uncharacterized membrane protein YphA (DoxX/SURF4 family)
MRTLHLLGRAIFGTYFVYSGIRHFVHVNEMSGYARSKGAPAPEAAVRATGAMLIAGGASVLAGVKPRQGLATLIAFLLPVSLKMHDFWNIADAQQQQVDLINFTKNMALVGAALMMMQLPEPWPASVPTPHWRSRYGDDWHLGDSGGWNYPSGFGGQFAFRLRNPDALPA